MKYRFKQNLFFISVTKNLFQIFKLKSFENILWLVGDRVLRLGVGLLIGVLVARYLGPDLYGKWNYVIAFVSLISAFSTLGFDQIIVKYLVNDELEESKLIGTAFFLRIAGTLVSTLIAALFFFYYKKDDQLLIIGLMSVFNLWFQTFDVIDLKNQSILKSKNTVIVKNGAFLITSILRILFVYFGFSLLSFVVLALLESFLSATGLILYYGYKNLFKWKFNFIYSKILIKQSWPLILSSVVIMMYMRLDQIMIGDIMDEKSVGFYSVSSRFAELFYFLPSVFVTSLFPHLISKSNQNEFEYKKSCLKLFKILFVISLFIAIIFTFSSKLIISNLYGDLYLPAVGALKVSIWTGIFVFWGVAAGNILVIENMNKHNLIKSLHGLILNIILNMVLIPKYGINGAAFATLISQFYASYLYYFINKQTRHIFILQTKSIYFFN